MCFICGIIKNALITPHWERCNFWHKLSIISSFKKKIYLDQLDLGFFGFVLCNNFIYSLVTGLLDFCLNWGQWLNKHSFPFQSWSVWEKEDCTGVIHFCFCLLKNPFIIMHAFYTLPYPKEKFFRDGVTPNNFLTWCQISVCVWYKT